MVFSNTIRLNMKDKKIKIVFCIAIVLIIIGCIVGCALIMKNNSKNTETKVEREAETKPIRPDIFIKGTKENPIKLKGFEVTDIKIYNIKETSLEVKATVVNKSSATVNGFFIEIDLYNKDEKLVTKIVQNCNQKIKAGKSYVLNANVVGLKKSKDITSVKILKLEKETATNLEETFDRTKENKKSR